MPISQMNSDDASNVEIYVPHLDQKNNLNGTNNIIRGLKTIHASGLGTSAVIELTPAPAAGKTLFIQDVWYVENSGGSGAGGSGFVPSDDYMTVWFFEEDNSASNVTDPLWTFFWTTPGAHTDPRVSVVGHGKSLKDYYPQGLRLNTADKKLVCQIQSRTSGFAESNRDLNAFCGVTYMEVD